MERVEAALKQERVDELAKALHVLLLTWNFRRYQSKPVMLAGSVYAGLHNDVGLFEVLSESKPWTVRQVADAFSASFTIISSALIGSRIKDWLSACAALKIDASFRLNSTPMEANLLQS